MKFGGVLRLVMSVCRGCWAKCQSVYGLIAPASLIEDLSAEVAQGIKVGVTEVEVTEGEEQDDD